MRFVYTITAAVLLVSPLSAQTSFRGPLPQEQKDIISYLADHHTELKRRVSIDDTGYSAVTTSENPVLVEKLKAHFAYMEKRLDSGAMVRRWDPAFAEMVEYYDQLEAVVEPLEDGIRVVVSGKSPEAVRVAQNHALIVTGFVSEGRHAVQRTHSTVIPAMETACSEDET